MQLMIDYLPSALQQKEMLSFINKISGYQPPPEEVIFFNFIGLYIFKERRKVIVWSY